MNELSAGLQSSPNTYEYQHKYHPPFPTTKARVREFGSVSIGDSTRDYESTGNTHLNSVQINYICINVCDQEVIL